jgi:hypothetical protein
MMDWQSLDGICDIAKMTTRLKFNRQSGSLKRCGFESLIEINLLEDLRRAQTEPPRPISERLALL